jgi:AraC-like DNA-binding protein
MPAPSKAGDMPAEPGARLSYAETIPGHGPPTSHYREFRPRPAPGRHLVCLWSQRISAGESPYQHRVLPDGCADLVFIGEAPPIVAGPATRAVIASLPAGSIIIGARFRPGVAPGFLGPPASELKDQELPLFDLWGSAASSLSARIAEAALVQDKIAALEGFLVRRPLRAGRADSLVSEATCRLARHRSIHMRELSRSLGISERQLQRRFRAAVGYGPKTFQRVLRLQRLLALAAVPHAGSAAELALDAGYADQAHMSREVRALAGGTPGALLARTGSTLAMSDLFNTPCGPDL